MILICFNNSRKKGDMGMDRLGKILYFIKQRAQEDRPSRRCFTYADLETIVPVNHCATLMKDVRKYVVLDDSERVPNMTNNGSQKLFKIVSLVNGF